ncbi:MAG: 4Fe-4S dicluster domain-containing protein [Chlorobiaceae bacterium]|nr:4Fe-4S dicluster domain-containing protein [Chlorobiaceae bacterium]
MKTGVLPESDSCFGCGACEQICSAKAIRMCPDSDGFQLPIINISHCTSCYLCLGVCPAITQNMDSILNQPIRVYAARNKDPEMLMQSTSGALFPIIANEILAKGGVVYGCAWAGSDITATHIRVQHERDLHRLSHSKYVQSINNETYISVKSDLNRQLSVLYSGTPCQIAGLRLFLKKEYPGLLTIDLLCHGVPGSKMFSAYIDWLAKQEHVPIDDLRFRDKKVSGFRAYVSFRRPDGSRRFRLAGLEPYMYGFYREYFNRESCYSCPFKQSHRSGDITIADYWGLELHHPELKEWLRYGASLCLINTNKGMDWEATLGKCAELVGSRIEYASEKNPALNTPPELFHRPELRDRIYRELNEHGFEWIAARYLRPRFAWLHYLVPAYARNLLRTFRR